MLQRWPVFICLQTLFSSNHQHHLPCKLQLLGSAWQNGWVEALTPICVWKQIVDSWAVPQSLRGPDLDFPKLDGCSSWSWRAYFVHGSEIVTLQFVSHNEVGVTLR